MNLTPLFIKRNREERQVFMGSHDNTRSGHGEAALQGLRSPTPLPPNISLCPGGLKVSAKTFAHPDHPNREMEGWKENTRGEGGGQVALLMTQECGGNAVNEEGWDKTPSFPRRDREALVGNRRTTSLSWLTAVTSQENQWECWRQECGENRIWL